MANMMNSIWDLKKAVFAMLNTVDELKKFKLTELEWLVARQLRTILQVSMLS